MQDAKKYQELLQDGTATQKSKLTDRDRVCYNSTAANLCGKLVIVGGAQDWSQVNSILQLVDGEWVRVGSMARVGVIV